VDGNPLPGEEVWVKDSEGNIFGRGFFNPFSQYRVRLMATCGATDGSSPLKDSNSLLSISLKDLITKRIVEAIALRNSMQLPSTMTSVYRLVNGEGDRLGGLMIDVIGNIVVVQSSALWVEYHSELIGSILEEQFNQNNSFPKKKIIWRKSESRLKQDGYTDQTLSENAVIETINESIEPLESPIHSNVSDDDDDVVVLENGVSYLCSPANDQKTGFYCDQRDTRMMIRALSSGRTVLDTYCYTGGFSLNAIIGGATQVTAVDSSQKALDALSANIALNTLNPDQVELLQGDAMAVMTSLHQQNRTFDIVICDPPKLAPSRAMLAKATNKYKKINTIAMKLVKPGGLLLSCTCSAAMTQALPPAGFEAMLVSAAKAAQREVSVLRSVGAGPDHPVLLSYPEGRYLTAALLFVT